MPSLLDRRKATQRRALKKQRARVKKRNALNAAIAKARKNIQARRKLIRQAETPLRERVYQEAVKCLGIVEKGGNNVGPEVEQIIREGGGRAGDAWCGWFLAAMLKRAGSKAASWQMGAVRLWLPLSGVKRISRPVRGDVVRFTFDHIGLFEKDNGDGTITTIEGNTGSTGAVSDSAAGKDGVKRKVRSKSLVNDYLRVTR